MLLNSTVMTLNPAQSNELKCHAWHKTVIILITGLMFPAVLYAQEKQAGQAVPLFQSEEILDLDLKADFNKVFSVKDDSTYFPARLSWTENNGLKREIEIKIRTRGNARRNKDICRFPPLRLNFPKDATKGTPFQGQKNIKLVTHCDKADFYEQNTMVEYLIYKAFNILSDSSFKVRPVMMNYINPGEKTDTVRKFAFFTEPEKSLAGRLHAIEIKTGKIHPDRWDPFQTCLVDMFQYMIGNTDYSIYELHNIVMFQDSVKKSPPVPVPFDFDFSGLVSANYAVPNPMMNTGHVTERVYRGFKKDQVVIFRTIQLFNTRKDEIYRVFEDFPLLNSSEKKKAVKYLDEFYGIINDKRKVKSVFIDGARTVE